jgi:Fe-S-cluster containining protein
MSQDKFNIPFTTPVVPNLLDGSDTIQFRCHTEISCFNACCRQADITLTPYDILRLKNRLGISATEVLEKHTVPFEMDASGMPGIKLKTEAEQPTCLFLTEKGCGIYEDRPSACRYYPMGLMTMRVKEENFESHRYCMVVEDHCKGHEEDRKLTVAEYRKEQGVEEYDEINKEWYQIILKKRSSGPVIGKPTATSFQVFFMVSYDIDRFRRFVESPSFKDTYPLGEDIYKSFADDVVLLTFGFKFLKQVLFAEMTIPVKENALVERHEKRKNNIKLQRIIELEEHNSRVDQYKDSK